MTKLSIITPCFNSEKFIQTCIENVAEQIQGLDCVEHLIMDGQSTDTTIALAKELSVKYSHIRIISEKDNGQSDAMNKGIHLAQGEIIGFLNVDDGYLKGTVKRALKIFNSHSSAQFIVGNCKLIDQDGYLIYTNRPQRIQDYHLFSKAVPFPINPSAYFYKKEIHNHPQVGKYDMTNPYCMDYDFILKASRFFHLKYYNEDWGFMLQHPEAKTTLDREAGNLEMGLSKVHQRLLSSAPTKLRLTALTYSILTKMKGR